MTRTGYHIHVSMHCITINVTNWPKLLVDKNIKENYHLLKHLFKEINVLARLNSKRFLQPRSFRSFPIQISDLSSLGHWTPLPLFLKIVFFIYHDQIIHVCRFHYKPPSISLHYYVWTTASGSFVLFEQTKENIRLGFDSFSLFQI